MRLYHTLLTWDCFNAAKFRRIPDAISTLNVGSDGQILSLTPPSNNGQFLFGGESVALASDLTYFIGRMCEFQGGTLLNPACMRCHC